MVAKNAPNTRARDRALAARERAVGGTSRAGRAVPRPGARRRRTRRAAPAPPARNASVGADVQPSSTLLLMAYTIAISPAVTVTAPATSARTPGTGSPAGHVPQDQADEHDPIGHVDEEDPLPPRPARSARRSGSRRRPRRCRPRRRTRPSALLRSAPSRNVLTRIDSAAGDAIAAPTPWAARDATSGASDPASPAVSDASGEHAEAGGQHPAPAEQVGGPAAEQQQPAEREPVGDDDPLEVGGGEPEIGLDRRAGRRSRPRCRARP